MLGSKKTDSPKVTDTKVIQVPDQDDAAEFFTPTATQEDIEVTSEDFDHIFRCLFVDKNYTLFSKIEKSCKLSALVISSQHKNSFWKS